MPRDFEEHRYFCSIGVHVPTEKFNLVFFPHAKEVEMKMYQLVFQETRRRVGGGCRLTEWQGRSWYIRLDGSIRGCVTSLIGSL